MRQVCLLILTVFISACSVGSDRITDGGVGVGSGGGNGGGGGAGSSALTCTPCVQSSDCSGGACVQYGGDNYCGASCRSDADCGTGESCTLLTSVDAMEASVCIPKSALCGPGTGCTNCPSGTSCDVSTGQCITGGSNNGGGGSGGGSSGGGSCPGYAGPSESSCCKSCTSGSNCQANGCYGGWYCDTSTCGCHAPPSSCGSGGGGSGGAGGSGGTTPPPTYTGSIGANGGSVSSLYFAVIGDTRPANIDDTANYPSAIINKIYADIAAMSPQPQFIVTTGDYMFASTSGSQQQPQMDQYVMASKQYTTGPIFAAMGNHECTGATASNCAGSPTSNMNVYMNALVTPLGKSTPYYTIPINDTAGKWTAKIVIAACNDWDSTQQSWLQGELAKPTTYTFVVRHEPTGTSGPPCVSQMDSMLQSAKYDLFIVGHSHTFNHSGTQVVVGNGGAPITSGVNYGYATIAQQPSGGFLVSQYDYMTAQVVNTFTVQ